MPQFIFHQPWKILPSSPATNNVGYLVSDLFFLAIIIKFVFHIMYFNALNYYVGVHIIIINSRNVTIFFKRTDLSIKFNNFRHNKLII